MPDLLVLLGRCLVRVEPTENGGRGVSGGEAAGHHWERAVRLDPDCGAAAGFLKSYRRAVASGGGKMAVEESVVAEERRQAALARGGESDERDKENMARPDLVRSGSRKQHQHQTTDGPAQTLTEKQATRVEALRSAQTSEAEQASERARLATGIIAQLQSRVRGKRLREALDEFRIPVKRNVPETEAIASAYRKGTRF